MSGRITSPIDLNEAGVMAGRDLVNATVLPTISSAKVVSGQALANNMAIGGIIQLAAVLVVDQGQKRAEHMLLAIAAAIREQGMR